MLRTAGERLRPSSSAAPVEARAPLEFHQREPEGDWDTWIIRTGRGAGKTEAAARSNLEHLRSLGSGARLGIGAPTIKDVRETCLEGASGLITLAPNEFRYNRSLLEAFHVKGGYVKGMGSEKPQRWNGPQWTRLWWDELALSREASFKESRFGLRMPPHPQLILTTTPKRTKFVHDLETRPNTVLALTEDGRIPSMFDNPHLAPEVAAMLLEEYGGTDLARSEIYGEWLEEVQGALWKRQWLNDFRVGADEVPALTRLVIGVDPSGSGSAQSDECGIMLGGLGSDGHGYVLADLSMRASPDVWAQAIAELYDDEMVDLVVAERNYGGEMVEKTIKVAHPTIAYKPVNATRGKEVRAQPIALLYQQGRIHHVGSSLAALEDEQVTFAPNTPGQPSPNRMDALVWLMTELMGISNRYGGWGGHMARELAEMKASQG